MSPIVLSTVATRNCYKEFLLTKYSLEQYHDCLWYVSCDDYTHKKISHIDNVEAVAMVDSDECDHNSTNQLMRDTFLKVILTKFDISLKAIKEHGSVLFLDSDMLFVNGFEDRVINIINDRNLDAIISQHMTNNWQNEAHHGYFNVGMFLLRNTEMIDQWRFLSENHKQLNMYYEQKPLEYVQRNYITANFPINYNIGWWRFNESHTRSRLDKVCLKDNKIYFGDKHAVNFHLHLLKDSQINHGKFLMDKIFDLMQHSNNNKYREFLTYFDEVTNE
jgi:hypothetical protein